MTGNNLEKGPKIRIVSAPSTEELATGKVGEETLEQLPGVGRLTRKQITEALEKELGE